MLLYSQIFAIRNQRAELREEIQDVLALVESNYLEEQRKQKQIDKVERIHQARRQKQFEQVITIGIVLGVDVLLFWFAIDAVLGGGYYHCLVWHQALQ